MADKVDNQQPDIERARDLLSPYLDDEVSEAERALVEQALAVSPELRDELESLRQTVDLVASLPQMPAPRPFTLSEAQVKAPAPTRKKFLGLPAWAGGLAMLATALVCVLAAGGLLFGGGLMSGIGQQADEIAFQAAEPQAEMIAEESAEAEAMVEEEVIETIEVEKEVVVEKEVELTVILTPEAAAKEEALAPAPPEEAAADEEMAEMTEAEEAPAEEAASEAPAEADDADRGRDTGAGAGVTATSTTTPTPLSTPTPAAALAAPATEPAEEKVGLDEGEAEQPAAEEATPLPAEPQPEGGLPSNQKPLPTATTIAQATPTPAAVLLTEIPPDTPEQERIIDEEPTAAEKPAGVPYRIIVVSIIALGLLVVLMGLIVWLIKRSRR